MILVKCTKDSQLMTQNMTEFRIWRTEWIYKLFDIQWLKSTLSYGKISVCVPIRHCRCIEIASLRSVVFVSMASIEAPIVMIKGWSICSKILIFLSLFWYCCHSYLIQGYTWNIPNLYRLLPQYIICQNWV